MSTDIFLLKLEKDLPKYPYYVTDWTELKYDEDGDDLKSTQPRFISPLKDFELHFEKRNSIEFHFSEDPAERYSKIDSEYYTFYNIKERKSDGYASVHHNYYRKDGPARIEKSYNYKTKKTTYYCRWYPNLQGAMCRQHGPASYKININEKNELEIVSFEWLTGKRHIHKDFSPAVYSFNKYRWFYNNREHSSYNYWIEMIGKYPSKYKAYEDDAKIVIESKAPSPSILYKKNKNAVWKLNNKTVSMKKYWDHYENQNVKHFILE